MPDLPSPTPENGSAATPATEPAPATGTVQPNGDAGTRQSAPVEESFTRVDPNTLPPELRHAYDNMLRDYKEGTTKLSERIKSETAKAVEAYKQKAEWYDSALKDEKLVKMINEYVNSAAASNDPSMANLPKELQEKLRKVDEIDQELKQTKAIETVNAFKEAADDKGNLLHPEFEKYQGMTIGTHPELGEYSILRAAVELALGETPAEKLENAYKTVDAMYKSAFEEGRKAGMGRVQEKLKNGSQPPSSVNAASTAPRQPKNALEALQFARQGLVPNRG